MAYQKERALFQLNLPSCVARRLLCQVVMMTKSSGIVKEFLSLYQAKLFISIYCAHVNSSGSLRKQLKHFLCYSSFD